LNNITFSSFEVSHIEEAIKLVSIYYQTEKESVPILPPFSDYSILLKKNLEALCQKGIGISLFENGIFLGFMAGYPIEHFFGTDKGVFVPVFGHATKYSRRVEIEQMLYIEAARRWVKKSIFSHSVAIFAHDEELLKLWFHQGFGNRCVDAIRFIQPKTISDSFLHFDEITTQNASFVASIHEEHHLYYRSSPIFMPNEDEDALSDIINWLSTNSNRMFYVKINDTICGYIRYQNRGESLFSIHPQMKNITGLYVLPQYRHLGIGEKLLNYVETILNKENITLLGVDFESINPKANHFWNKQFIPYTYSLVRRIDERIIDFKEDI